MAHFARVENSVVTNVQVVDNKVITVDGVEEEQVGKDFLAGLFGGVWVQTSYHGHIRGNYAGIGYTYDENLDAFIPPKPPPTDEVADWVLDEETFTWVEA